MWGLNSGMNRIDPKRISGLNAQELFLEAQRLEHNGFAPSACDVARVLIKQRSDWGPGYYALGSALCAKCRLDDAYKELRKAIQRDSNQSGFYTRIAEVAQRLGRYNEALEAAQRGVELSPNDPQVVYVLGIVLRTGGEHKRSHEVICKAVESGVTNGALEGLCASIEGQIGLLDQGIERVGSALEQLRNDSQESDDRSLAESELLMIQSRLLDQAGQYEHAFSAAQEGGALQGAQYDAQSANSLCDERISAWNKEVFDGLKCSRTNGESLVFIVGMPRSGTSLVEQIIASHPLGYGCGELMESYLASKELEEPNEFVDSRAQMIAQLKPAPLDRKARTILKSMKKNAHESKGKEVIRISDKLPNNYEHVGMIRLMFPKAKIIHCNRRAIDTCLSCYMLDFVGRTSHAYSYALDDLVNQYTIYERYMNHWRNELGIEMLDVGYEHLVHNPEDGARRIIEYIGLEWDERCARAHETNRSVSTLSSDQVREKIYTRADGRWKNYEDQIGVLIDGLGIQRGVIEV